jgi:uncharacterized glyoxalase superfamily protein PhnB
MGYHGSSREPLVKILGVTPMLTVTALEPAIAFYRDTLGFFCLNSTPEWASMGRDGNRLMLALPNAHLAFEKPHFTGSLYFHVQDVRAFWERLKDRCEVVYPLEDFKYGKREFAIRDNSGYLLQFGQAAA